jgi:YD repeat-containing protein
LSGVARSRGNTWGSCANGPIDEQFGYDARGLLVAAQNASVGLIREYDALGRMLREIDTRFGTGVGYAYDAASRLTSKVYPDGSSMHYAYDGAGRPVGISDPFGETTPVPRQWLRRRRRARGHAPRAGDGRGLVEDGARFDRVRARCPRSSARGPIAYISSVMSRTSLRTFTSIVTMSLRSSGSAPFGLRETSASRLASCGASRR